MSVAVNFADDIPVLTYTRPSEVRDESSSGSRSGLGFESEAEPQFPSSPLSKVDDSKDSGFTYINWSKSSTLHVQSITNKWSVLIISSLLVGYITTLIDLAAVWLNDLKKGFCFSKIDKWSLLSPYSTCPTDDWHNWSQIIFGLTGIPSNIFINLPIYSIFAFIFIAGACYVSNKAPEINYSGIAEIKLIIAGLNHQVSQYLGFRTLVYKTIGLVLVVSSGLWLGKEGPLVHVSCCILNLVFNLVYRQQENDEFLRRELLSAAGATGISVAFNAPIGGVLFMLESVQSYFMPTKLMWNSFISATIAVVVLTSFKIFTDGENFLERDLFSVEFGNFSWLFIEFIPFTFLGVLGGFYGYWFTKLHAIYSSYDIRRRVRNVLSKLLKLDVEKYGKSLEVFLVLTVTIAFNFPFEITRLPLQAYMKLLFTDCPEDDDSDGNPAIGAETFICSSSNLSVSFKLIYIFIQGFVLSSYTYGLSLPGGVLMPSLALGATIGRLIGIISQSIQNGIGWGITEECTKSSCLVSPSAYAVVGAASFMSGITKLTMCVVVIIFELTGAVTYVLPIMIAVMVSKFVNDWLCNDNIYDHWLKNNFNVFTSPSSSSITNSGKGSGLSDFVNSTSIVKSKLPDIITSRIMIPISRVRCIELVKSYSIEDLQNQFLNGDNHEGYPVIGSYRNPVSLGYVKKEEIRRQISQLQYDNETEISFQIGSERLPNSVISEQLRDLQQKSPTSTSADPYKKVSIQIEKSLITLHEKTPIVTLIEIFEKLHFNYGIILKSADNDNFEGGNSNGDQIMSGFVDRFLISKLVNSQFEELHDDLAIASEYDLDILSLDRQSTELIT
ncbi:hypothetical protein CLIB1423_17S01024 [[Candida] railenensis]|uniref:Chloride channel protein n=1 Tax=[Candida] railenensis TaxID=45579 RepID=A0A9P0QUG3_9ASCO|nr:hypothetical protein CLIB1423_17S01024 [[Candida] railenensis]